MPQEIVQRRSLPHWYMPGAAHFITYRLAGTLPAHVVEELKVEKRRLLAGKPSADTTPRELRNQIHKQLFAKYEEQLDKNCQSIEWLRDARIAAVIRTNLYHHHGSKYHLMAYCVMPNHVHVLLCPTPEYTTVTADGDDRPIGEIDDKLNPLSGIMHSLKSYTANRANEILERNGRFWQPESYDHWVRDEDELERIVNYIRANPVKAGLVDRHEEWHCCSCRDRYLIDGDTSGWLIDK